MIVSSGAPRYCEPLPKIDKAINFERLNELSVPRALPGCYFLNRRSVYWVDKEPPKSNGNTKCVNTERMNALSLPKSVAYIKHKPDRDEPIWDVSNAARFHEASDRVLVLAEPKSLPNTFMMRRVLTNQPGEGRVSESARFGKPTTRILSLSAPLERKKYKLELNQEISHSGVTDAARKAEPSEHTVNLAMAKNLAKDFVHLNKVERSITDEIKRAVASARVQQLARPKSARLKFDDYEAYKVSNNAKKAIASTRVCELSEPIPRKVKTKK